MEKIISRIYELIKETDNLIEFEERLHLYMDDLAAELLGVCRHEIKNSTRVTLAECRNRTCWQRFIDRLAWSFRRLL